MNIPFYKYHGAGNDFILTDNRDGGFPVGKALIARLCTRHTGVGADGLILLENSREADFAMRYFNADGGESTMCGNGGRCIAAFAKKLGMIGQKTRFEAVDGNHEAEILHSEKNTMQVSLRMQDVDHLTFSNGHVILNTGSPHFVKFVDDVDEIDVDSEGRRIRYDSEFAPGGINVNFVRRTGSGLMIRTYERGVENETLACGTGTVASALAAARLFSGLRNPVEVNTRGGILKVKFEKHGEGYTNVYLEGPAVFVFEGKIPI